ncbi:hypothetical protein Tco_1150932 [Tanacetum coccineum]
MANWRAMQFETPWGKLGISNIEKVNNKEEVIQTYLVGKNVPDAFLLEQKQCGCETKGQGYIGRLTNPCECEKLDNQKWISLNKLVNVTLSGCHNVLCLPILWKLPLLRIYVVEKAQTTWYENPRKVDSCSNELLNHDIAYAREVHLESLLTISLDNLCLDNLDIFKEDLEYHSCRSLYALDSSYFLVLVIGTSQSRQHDKSESVSYYLTD